MLLLDWQQRRAICDVKARSLCVDWVLSQLWLFRSLAFKNPISRASKPPDDPAGRIFERDVRSQGQLRELIEHAPAKSAPRRGRNGRTTFFAPFHREAVPVSTGSFQAPHDVDAACIGRESSVFGCVSRKLMDRHADCLGGRRFNR
jgi:hypothetical protein